MFGQYSNDWRGRTTMAEFRRRYPTGTVRKPRTCTGHNRVVVHYPDGTTRFILHNTAVVTRYPNGRIILADNGWATMTTRRAMSQGLRELTGHQGVNVFSGDKKAHALCIVSRAGNGDYIRDVREFDSPFETAYFCTPKED